MQSGDLLFRPVPVFLIVYDYIGDPILAGDGYYFGRESIFIDKRL